MITTERSFHAADRYFYDSKLSRDGFDQIATSQDAWYFGTWANPNRREIWSYCEGDVCITTCDTDAEFRDEMNSMKHWNVARGHQFIGVDTLNESHIQDWINIGLTDLIAA